MKKELLLFCFFCLITFAVQAQKSDHELVAQTVNYYLEGGTNNDFNSLKKAFHKDATMKFVGDDGYKEVNALEFFGKGAKDKPGPKQNRKTYISQINISGTAANARLEIVYPEVTLIDFMNLLKIDGEWKIVNKIFYGRSLKKLFPDIE